MDFNYLVFDIETYSPGKLTKIDTKEFRPSVIGCYCSWNNQYLAFFEEHTEDFINLLSKTDLVVGFNQLWFDLPVLQKFAHFDLLSLPNYDILIEFEKKAGFKTKLDEICKATLGSQKTDNYQQYKDYYWDEKWFELVDYCMHDVKLTKELFDLILTSKPLKYNDLMQTREVLLDLPKPGKIEIQEAAKSIF